MSIHRERQRFTMTEEIVSRRCGLKEYMQPHKFQKILILMAAALSTACGPKKEESKTPAIQTEVIETQTQNKFFEDRVYDSEPTQLYPDPNWTEVSDDTARLQEALNAAALEDYDGGVVILNSDKAGSKNFYRIGRVDIPSNIRIEIDPDVTIILSADPLVAPGKPKRKAKGTFDRNRLLFAIGNTPKFLPDGTSRAPGTGPRIENVEIRSTVPGKQYTIDLAKEFPVEYWFRPTTFSKPDHQVEIREDGQNEVWAAFVSIGYVHNFRIADAQVLDNDTVLPAVYIYPDSDMKMGSLQFEDPRPADNRDKSLLDAEGMPIKHGDLIDRDGTLLKDNEAVIRNWSWGRTASKGTVENIWAYDAHTGYGLVQLFAGEDIELRNLHGEGGITVRLEPGSGSDRMNRSGTERGRIANVEIENISNTRGFTALWMNPHGKHNRNIKAKDIRAYDSGSTILIQKSSICNDCRDLERGYFQNVQLSGEVLLEKTTEDPVAEIGYYSTYFIHPDVKAKVADRTGNDSAGHATLKPDGRITPIDMPNPAEGRRWFLTEAIVPIMALSQLSEDNIGRIDEDGDGVPDTDVDRSDFFAVDYTNVNIVRRGNIRRPENIVYRNDAIGFENGKRDMNLINR